MTEAHNPHRWGRDLRQLAVRSLTPGVPRAIASADQGSVRSRMLLIPLAAVPLSVLLVLVALVAPAVARA